RRLLRIRVGDGAVARRRRSRVAHHGRRLALRHQRARPSPRDDVAAAGGLGVGGGGGDVGGGGAVGDAVAVGAGRVDDAWDGPRPRRSQRQRRSASPRASNGRTKPAISGPTSSSIVPISRTISSWVFPGTSLKNARSPSNGASCFCAARKSRLHDL